MDEGGRRCSSHKPVLVCFSDKCLESRITQKQKKGASDGFQDSKKPPEILRRERKGKSLAAETAGSTVGLWLKKNSTKKEFRRGRGRKIQRQIHRKGKNPGHKQYLSDF